MAEDHHFVIFVIVYIILLVEILYFSCAAVTYLFKNPRYRVFWAACYVEPTQEDIQQPYAAVAIHSPAVESKSHAHSTVASANRFQPDTSYIVSKKTAFIHYGLDTISHSFLMPTFLVSMIIFMISRMNMQFIKHAGTWSEEEAFCDFVYKSFTFVAIAHHVMLVMLCIPALKAEYLYQSTSCHRQFVIFVIIWITLEMITEIVKGVSVSHDVVIFSDELIICIPVEGIGMELNWAYWVVAQFYFCLVLTFLVVIIPICYQRKRLMDFQDVPSDTQENKELKTLLTKINKMSKRVCIGASVWFSLALTVNVLFWEFSQHPTVQPYLSMVNTCIYVQLFVVISAVNQNWKQRLCPWGCFTQISPSEDEKDDAAKGNEEERAVVTNVEVV
eukprot:217202_1